MIRSRLALGLFGLAALAALIVLTQTGTPTPAGVATPAPQAEAVPPAKPQPGQGNEIIQEFPAGGDMQTAWKVTYKVVNPGAGLVITGAWLKTSPNAAWLKVLENL